MQILRPLKNIDAVKPQYFMWLISSLQIQIIFILLYNQQIKFFKEIIQLTQIGSFNVIKICIILNLALNLIELTYLIVYKIVGCKNFKFNGNIIFKILNIKPYIFYIQIINVNALIFKRFELVYAIFAVINIVFVIGELFVLQIATKSYRFCQENYIKRRNFSLISWLLIIPIVITKDYIGSIYSGLFLLLRSCLQILSNIMNLQNEIIRFVQFLYPLLSIQIVIFIAVNDYFHQQLSQTLPFFISLLVFTVYTCFHLTQSISLNVLKYHLKKTQSFLQGQLQEQSQEGQSSGTINNNQIQKYLLVLRILVKVYTSKRNQRINQQIINSATNSFDNWWNYFNRIIINHRINCNKPTCTCKLLKTRSPSQNNLIQQQIFIQTIFSCIKKLIKNTSSKNIDLALIQRYFYIEIQKRPLKSYYEIIKLTHKVQKKQHILQLQCLIKQNKEMFEQVFMKQKAQNQNLQIQPILEFQTKLIQMRKIMGIFAVQYKVYYEMFSNTLVQIQKLKDFAENLQNKKKQFKAQLDQYLSKFDRNLQFLTFCFVYYRFFDEYTNKVDIVQSKIRSIYELNASKNNKTHKGIDIFDPQYGAIKIDLVFHPGKIVGATKNICSLLGYKIQQVSGHRINKIMPFMFSRYHDMFLKKFIQKGSLNMLKRKDRVFYAKNNKKFLFPITVRIKVQYLGSQNFYASSLIKKTPTKSNFILLNNYGKIEQISQSLYRLLFEKVFKQQISKIKKLNLYKMLLSLNHFLKDTTQNDDRIYQGTIMTSQNEEDVLAYYKANEGFRNYKKQDGQNQNQLSSKTHKSIQRSTKSFQNKSNGSIQNSSSYAQTRNNIDMSQDMTKFTSDMKQSFKQYLKLIDLFKVKAYKISFKFYDLVTSQFKCKILQVINIHQQLSVQTIQRQLPKQIIQVGQLYEIPQSLVEKFRSFQFSTGNLTSFNDKPKFIKNVINPSGFFDEKFAFLNSVKKSSQSIKQQSISFPQEVNQQILFKENLNKPQSQASSMMSVSEESKKKASMSTAFQKKIQQNEGLRMLITLLIMLMGLTLVTICIFSLTIKSDYQKLQNDNTIISNFQINFEFRLAVQQLYHFYHPLDLQPPQFLVSKKHLLTDNMKKQLINSIDWIDDDLSSKYYFEDITLVHADSGFQQKRPILTTLAQIYSMFLLNQQLGEHLSDNYIDLSTTLMKLVKQQQKLVLNKSQSFKTKIHVIVAFFVLFLVLLIIVMICLNRLSKIKESRIIDFLPFLNVRIAKKNTIFYQSLSQYIKQTQQIKLNQVQMLQRIKKNKLTAEFTNFSKNDDKLKTNQDLIPQLLKLKGQQESSTTNSRLIRVIKIDEKLLTFKNIIFGLFLMIICFIVVFQTQYLYAQSHKKFQAYINLKAQSMFVQNIPPRLILLYFVSTDDIIHNIVPEQFPSQFNHLGHEQTFTLRREISKDGLYGTQMEKNISSHFNQNICNLIVCENSSEAILNQDIYYMTYRFDNVYIYLKKIFGILLKAPDAKVLLKQWLIQSNVLEVLKATQYILQLMRKNQVELTVLFSKQLNQIQYIILFLSLTMIPLLILMMIFVRNKFLGYVSDRLNRTENIYKQLGWNMLSQNTYAVNYFQDKLKNAKKL